MKKTLSVLLSLVLAVSFAAVSFPAEAATNCFTVKITGTQYNTVAKTLVSDLNEAREDNNLDPLTVDSDLQKFAQQRAAETMLGYKAGTDEKTGEYIELCSDGTPMKFIYSGYGKTVFSLMNNDYAEFKTALTDTLSDASSAGIKSIGIASFKFKKVDSYYAIFSTTESKTKFTDFTNKSYTDSIDVHFRFISTYTLFSTPVEKKYFKHSVKGFFTGYYSNYLTIPNSQLVYKSLKPKIYKTKGSKGFVKGSGKYSIELYDKNNVAVAKFEKNLSAKINLKAPNTEILSKNKKQIYVRWQTFKDCSGYQIQYSLKKNMKTSKIVTVKGAKKNSRTLKKLKSNKKYYVRVRVYKNQGYGEKVYTKWSKKTAVKVK